MGQRKRPRSFDSGDGIEFVRCRICGDHRRVINSQHLSKHDTDRGTYMEEYHLTPDELIAKDFRVLQSSRPGYYPIARTTGLLRLASYLSWTTSRISC